MSRGRYLMVLRAPGVAFLLPVSLIARLPVAMLNLAIILRIATATGSYARAGAVTAVYVVATGVMSPVLGRSADRMGLRPVLTITAVVNTAGLVALALTPVGETLALLLIAAVAGGSLPPVAPTVRSLWARLGTDSQSRSALYAFDATMQEVTFMVGPTLVALISALSGPPAALLACAGVGLAGTLALTLSPVVAGPPPTGAAADLVEIEAAPAAGPSAGAPGDGARPSAGPPTRRRFQLAGTPGLATLVLVMFLFLGAIVIVEVSVVAFAGHRHESTQAGLLLATWSTGSMVGGLLFGARVAHVGARAVAALLLAGSAGFACLAAAPTIPVLYPLIFVAGLSIAPGFSCVYGLVGASAPAGGIVEAFSWVSSGIQMGAASGAALGGVLVDGIGTRFAMLFAAGAGLAAAGTAWRRTRHLRPSAA